MEASSTARAYSSPSGRRRSTDRNDKIHHVRSGRSGDEEVAEPGEQRVRVVRFEGALDCTPPGGAPGPAIDESSRRRRVSVNPVGARCEQRPGGSRQGSGCRQGELLAAAAAAPRSRYANGRLTSCDDTGGPARIAWQASRKGARTLGCFAHQWPVEHRDFVPLAPRVPRCGNDCRLVAADH